ncbi:MAG: class I SAM-dependent methyltransferase [Vicinamibacterales bacterium]
MEGWQGWDDYAAFYDWENARTMGRRDVRFWQSLASRIGGPVLELGCGTGRVSLPVARTGVSLFGVDRSSEMLARARRRLRRSTTARSLRLIRGDIRSLPFATGKFRLVIAPYGILQSLLDGADLEETLDCVSRVLRRGGTFGIDLVADLPAWDEYRGRIRLRGRRGGGRYLTLVESVRQDRGRGLTIFDQEYIEHAGGRRTSRRFSLAFRTVTIAEMMTELESAGFDVDAVLGDYDGRPWDLRAETWLILAKRR